MGSFEAACAVSDIAVEHHYGFAFWDKHCQAEAVFEGSQQAMVKRIKYFWPGFLEGQITFSVSKAGVVVGLAGCLVDEIPGTLSLSYVSVDPDYQSQGFCKLLVAAIARFAFVEGYATVSSSGYSESGLARLRPVLVRELQAMTVGLVDRAVVEY